MTDIDLVYLWVNGNDPKWQAKRNATIGKPEKMSAVNCEGRYANHDELKYSLRSVEKYAPWIRKVFIVTDNQVPEWLDTTNPKIQIVDHTEIMPEESLPCFNSSVIEHFLAYIPGLSECFIYANDDMYINQRVCPETFFASDGLPIIRLNRRWFRKTYLWFKEKVQGKRLSNYNQIVHNAAILVEKKYGKYYGDKAHHNMDAYLKSDCIHVEDIFHEELNKTFINHMRSKNDVQRSLFYYVALAERRGHLKHVTQKESLRIHIQNRQHYDKLKKYKPMLFCMNDSQFANDDDRKYAIDFLCKLFPGKSLFEK